MALDRLTQITSSGISSDSTITVSAIAGVITATSATVTGNLVGNTASFSGNVSIAGTLTYEDVTNIDSIGIITARSGINATGIVTATGFVGNVTGNVTGDVTGDINAGIITATSITGVSTAGITTAYIGSINDGPLSGARNIIINGDMRIDQRNAGASFTITGDTDYTLDRWRCRTYGGTGRFSVQQDSSSPNSIDPSAKLTVTTTDTSGTYGYAFSQRVEGYNFSPFAYGTAVAKTATISFWVRSSVTGTYCFSIRNGDGDRSYVAEYSISSADTWEYKTITFTGDTTGTWLTTNGIGALLEWSLGVQTAKQTTTGSWQSGNYVGTSNQIDWISNAGATFYITGVQLESGSVATPFERRSYGQELALCQRYYSTFPAALFGFPCPSTGGFAISQIYPFAHRMRVAPTVSKSYTSMSNVTGVNAQTITTHFMTDQIVGTSSLNTVWIFAANFTAEI
jgi:hypothetical protein